MTFTFTTTYDQKAMTALARSLRKTLRRKRSRRSHILSFLLILLAAVLGLGQPFGVSSAVTLLAGAGLLLVLLLEDRLNGYVARRRLLPGLTQSVTTFDDDGYHSTTAMGRSDFPYAPIRAIAETGEYFALILSENHAQVYDKATLTGGAVEDFRTFIQERSGCSLTVI